jgi:hypothetical protein
MFRKARIRCVIAFARALKIDIKIQERLGLVEVGS